MNSAGLNHASLGRPFTLGMLYNAQNDELITGYTLWDAKTLEENTVKNLNLSSKFDISTSDSFEFKSSRLNVEASLKVSCLSGMIEVGGSAKYLNDKKKFKNQSRVMCQYSATTNFKQLLMKDLGNMDKSQKKVIKKSSATHVVTAISYGANAFFVFDSEKVHASKVKEKKVKMEAVIKKIPYVGAGGKAKIELSDEEQELTKTFSCKFYGDFRLQSNPTTFEEAVQTYRELPQLLGEDGENAVPVKVWLTSLKNLDSEAHEMVNEISIGLVRKIEDALEDFMEIEMRCNDCLEDKLVENFPHIEKQLSSFQKSCGNYVSGLQKSMKDIIPSIREGTEKNESKLEKLFEDRDKSLFSHENLDKWMDDKEREINVIRSCVDSMEGITIVQTQKELDKEVLDPEVDQVLCFHFTSLETDDPILDAMANNPTSADLPDSGSTTEDAWYSNDEVVTKMTNNAKYFNNLARPLKNSSIHFLIAAFANDKYTGAIINLYENGKSEIKDARKPDLPNVERITDRTQLYWYITDLTLDQHTANGYLTLSDGGKKATYGALQTYPDHPDRFENNPQVFCKQGLKDCHYWEVGWSTGGTQSVYVAVAYKEIDKKIVKSQNQFGKNNISWAFGQHTALFRKHFLKAYHDGKVVWELPFPRNGCSKVGVYLDHPGGTLSFYEVTHSTVAHLFTFRHKFTDPLYPGFWINNKSNYAHLNRFE